MDQELDDIKSYTPLANVNLEPHNNAQFKFGKFILSGNSDSEDEDILMDSDGSDSEEEASNFEYSIQDQSSSSGNYSLTTEDWSVINSSQHPKLKKSLLMNRNVKYMTLLLFNKIKSILVKNQDKIRALKKSLEKNDSKECHIMFLGQLGAPYFKTKKDLFCSDPNKDTLDRKERGLLTIYQVSMSSKWSKTECDNLTRGVQLTYNNNKQIAALNEINALKEKLHKLDEDSHVEPQIIDEIERLKAEIRNLEAIGINDVPPLSQDKFIDWEHISTEFLRDKHNAQECSNFWHIYLHPDFNKSNWTREENKKIRLLAEKYNKQNWDCIAVELGTNRSAFSVFLHYCSALCDQLPKSRFTEGEDKKLVQHIESKKLGSYIPWNTISEFFPNRTKDQLKHRYKYYLRKSDQYTQQFSDAEDILIMLLVERFGRNYMKFTKYLPTKSYMQIKSRYDNHLRFRRIKGFFTVEEDKKILDHFKINSKTGSLSVALNRNRIQVRQRYKKLKDFFSKNPEKSLDDVQRRSGVKDETFRRLEFLKCIGDQFKECVDVPTIEEIERKLGKKKQSKSDHDIDILLLNFFSTSYSFKQKSLEITAPKITNAADKIYDILKSWRVKLEIPEEIRKNNMIDIIDVEILNLLRSKYQSDIHTPSIDDLLPPNMNTLVGLRGLLLKNQILKESKFNSVLSLNNKLPYIRNDQDNEIARELLDIFHKKDISSQCIIHNERSLFLERFISVFMWPALLSIEFPSEQISKLELRFKNSEPSINKKKHENKCKKNMIKKKIAQNVNVPVAKKRKLNDAKLQNCNLHTSIQPQRFSSRLKNRNQITHKIETVEVKGVFSAIERPHDVISVMEKNPEHLNGRNSNSIDQKIEITKFTNTESCGSRKIVPKNLNEITPQNLPTNLVKVHKSEIVKLLQNNKPVKIFKIRSIKKPDGTIITTNPSNMNISGSMENIDESIITSESSALVPFIQNMKNNLKAKLINTCQNTNVKNLNNSIKNNSECKPFRYREDIIHSTKSPKIFSESSKNTLLHNVGVDFPIDLTENQGMKSDVGQLDQLIKTERAFDLTSL